MVAVKVYYNYRCGSFNHAENKKLCNQHYINANRVEAVVWEKMSEILKNPRAAIARYKRQQHANQRQIDNAVRYIESIDEMLKELNTDREQVIVLFRKRVINEDRLEADIAAIDRQIEKLNKERTRWTTILEENTVTEAQLQEIEEIAASVQGGAQAVSPERISLIYNRLRLKLTAAREDGITVLYMSILG